MDYDHYSAVLVCEKKNFKDELFLKLSLQIRINRWMFVNTFDNREH